MPFLEKKQTAKFPIKYFPHFVYIESSTRLEKNYHRIDRTEVHLCNLQHCKCLHTLQVVCQIDIILNDAMQQFKKNFFFYSYILCRNYTKTSILHYFIPIFYPLCIKISTSNSQWRLYVVSSIKNSSRRRLRRAFFHFKCVKSNQGSTFTRSNFDNNVFDAGDFENELNFLQGYRNRSFQKSLLRKKKSCCCLYIFLSFFYPFFYTQPISSHFALNTKRKYSAVF